jgi:hypothetical protein
MTKVFNITTLINTVLEILARGIYQEKEIKDTNRREIG